MKLKRSTPLFSFLAVLALLSFHPVCNAEETGFKPLRVAHAGGGIDGKTYTNSFEALNRNLKKGFKYFEIDFSFTKDGELVCLHDWKGSFKKRFGFEAKERPTLKTFRRLLREKKGYENCTLDGLSSWLRQHPETTLITDVKGSNLEALSIVFKKIEGAHERVIPQVYQPENFKKVKAMGYTSIIWTLYTYGGPNSDVLRWIDNFDGSFAVTMPEKRAETALPTALAKKNISTYVHTVNNAGKAKRFITEKGVTEIYTDFLPPLKMP